MALEDVATRVVAGLEESQRARITTKASAAGMVRGDEELLVWLLENAVENALKFSTENVEIFVTEDSSLGEVLVDVQDHGDGLPKALRERVFEPFFRSPEARGANTQGHGIGLALVSRIAAFHGGRVGFEDPADGSGACLRLTLPMWKERV